MRSFVHGVVPQSRICVLHGRMWMHGGLLLRLLSISPLFKLRSPVLSPNFRGWINLWDEASFGAYLPTSLGMTVFKVCSTQTHSGDSGSCTPGSILQGAPCLFGEREGRLCKERCHNDGPSRALIYSNYNISFTRMHISLYIFMYNICMYVYIYTYIHIQ